MWKTEPLHFLYLWETGKNVTDCNFSGILCQQKSERASERPSDKTRRSRKETRNVYSNSCSLWLRFDRQEKEERRKRKKRYIIFLAVDKRNGKNKIMGNCCAKKKCTYSYLVIMVTFASDIVEWVGNEIRNALMRKSWLNSTNIRVMCVNLGNFLTETN